MGKAVDVDARGLAAIEDAVEKEGAEVTVVNARLAACPTDEVGMALRNDAVLSKPIFGRKEWLSSLSSGKGKSTES